MSLFNPDIDKPITTAPKFGLYSPKIINVNNKHSGIHLFNPDIDKPIKPLIDLSPKRPQYLIDRDRQQAIASANDDREEAEKIIQGIQKKDDENAFYSTPLDYEAGKLEGDLSSIITKL